MENFELLDKDCLEIMEWMQVKGYASNTIRQYKHTLKRLQKNHRVLNNKSLRKILKELKHQNQRAVLGMINNFCFDKGLDFYLKVPKIKVKPRKTPEIYSLEEINIIINSVQYPYNLAIRCLFNMGAGLRISEIIKFSWNHIRWAELINNKDNYGIAVIRSGKGSKDRVVNIPSKLMNDLYNYAAEKRILNEFNIPIGGMMFPMGKKDYKKELMNRNLEKWKDEYLKYAYDWFRYNLVKNKCEKALGKRIKIHSLRHCVSKDTEILTINGWKNYTSLNLEEEIFSYNLEKDCIEIDKIIKINKYNYKGSLDKIKNRYLNTLITPEHKIIIKQKKNKFDLTNWELLPFNKINKKTWNLSYKLSSKINSKDSLFIERAGILGWILSDGTISKRKRPSISISQSYTVNKEKCEYIENLLIKSNLKYTKKIKKHKSPFNKKEYLLCTFHLLNDGNHSLINLGKGHDWIFEYINKDRTPKLNKILKLSYEELSELYKCMILGDGTKSKTENIEYCGQDEKRIELIRILCVLLGKTSVQGEKKQKGKKYSRIYIRENKDYTQLSNQKKHFLKEFYDDIVWCPETNNGTFIAKRKNTIFITGNSKATYLYEIEKIPIERIQLLLGHSNLSTTMIYTKINPVSTFELLKETKEI